MEEGLKLGFGAVYPLDTEQMFMPGSLNAHTKFWIQGVHVKKLHPNAKLPQRGSTLAAGFDLCALDLGDGHQGYKLYAGANPELIPTGIAIDMTRMGQSMVGLIFPRSGLGHKKGLVLGNTVGVIDQDYQGEILISAWNRGGQPCIEISPGERIAQLVFMPILVPPLVEVDDFVMTTERGAGGFGSTGG